MAKIELKEITQVVEDLFLYVKKINLGIAWDYEFIREKSPALSFKQGTVQTIQQYIAGGYDAELPFIVYHKNSVSDTRQTLNITKPLNDLIIIFNKETEANFPNLKFKDMSITPIALEVVTTPEDASGIENNVAIYMATYRLIYHKKGRFE